MRKVLLLFAVLIAVTTLKAQEKILAPGMDIIGYGYNIFGKYADNSSKMPYPIFKFGEDVEKRINSSIYLVPDGILLSNTAKKEKQEISGSSQRDYAKSIGASVEAGVEGLVFSASVSSAFSSSWGSSEKQYFHTIQDATTIWKIDIDKRRVLKTILDPQAAKDIDTMEPKKLFELYGTHVIVSAYLGGRADYTTVTKITEEYSEKEISATVSGNYSIVSGSASGNTSTKSASINSNTKTSLTVTGGNAEYANDINNYEAYKRWADGIRERPVLCAFDKESLLPISAFASTDARKQILEAAFKELCKRYPLPEAFMSNLNFYVKSKTTGLFWDFSGFNYKAKTKKGKLLLSKKDSNKLGKSPNGNETYSLQGADRFIKVLTIENSDYINLQPQHCDEVITVHDSQDGYHVQLWTKKDGKASQMFKKIKVEGEENTYYLQSKKGNFYLAANGKKVVQKLGAKTEAMKWIFEEAETIDMAPIEKGKYTIQNVAGGKFMDLVGFGESVKTKQLSPIIISNGDTGPDQTFEFLPVLNKSGRFILQPLAGSNVLEVDGRAGKTKEENTGYILFPRSEATTQQFEFIYAGEPLTFYIRNVYSGMYLQVHKSVSSMVGSPILQTASRTAQAKWKLSQIGDYWAMNIPKNQNFIIKSTFSNQALNIEGDFSNGNTLYTHPNIYAPSQTFRFIPSGQHSWLYIQEQATKKNLDVQGFAHNNSARIMIHQYTGVATQFFAVKPTGAFTCAIVSNGFKAISIHEGKINEKGKGIILWDLNHHVSEQFQLIYADGPKKGQPFLFLE